MAGLLDDLLLQADKTDDNDDEGSADDGLDLKVVYCTPGNVHQRGVEATSD